MAAADADGATREHVAYTIAAVFAELGLGTLRVDDWGARAAPFFVTIDKWNPKSAPWAGGGASLQPPPPPAAGKDWDLRGCIGSLSPRPLRELAAYACRSAFHDRRFAPVAASEFGALKFKVSLLVGFEPAPGGPEDWDLDTHGIVVEFDDASGATWSATYLPHVAREQGWTKRQALESLVRKSGYPGPATAALVASMRVTRYRSTTAEMTTGEWEALSRERRFLH
jgi:AMME syndrome candidate gene 1 protein